MNTCLAQIQVDTLYWDDGHGIFMLGEDAHVEEQRQASVVFWLVVERAAAQPVPMVLEGLQSSFHV